MSKKKEPIINDNIMKWLLISTIVVVILGSFTLLKNKDFTFYNSTDISVGKLQSNLNNEIDVIVYFYKKDCPYCVTASPKIIKSSAKYSIDIKTLDMEDLSYNDYDLRIVPTVIHYKDGIEIDRIEGDAPKEKYDDFFKNSK